jgi:hypothetical protein
LQKRASADPTAFTPICGEELFSEDQLAEFCNKKVRTIRWWRRERRGPAWLTIGRDVVYRKSSVLEWLKQSEVQLQPVAVVGGIAVSRRDELKSNGAPININTSQAGIASSIRCMRFSQL